MTLLSAVTPIVAKGRIAVRKTNTAIRNESKELITSVRKGDMKSALAVKNPGHGILKYGALGFLIPIPGLQIVGMATGAIVGCIPMLKKMTQKAIQKIK